MTLRLHASPGLVEEDYEWITRLLVRLANTHCSGRVVSVLEGGYKIQGGVVSAFARSVAAHVSVRSSVLVWHGRAGALSAPCCFLPHA